MIFLFAGAGAFLAWLLFWPPEQLPRIWRGLLIAGSLVILCVAARAMVVVNETMRAAQQTAVQEHRRNYEQIRAKLDEVKGRAEEDPDFRPWEPRQPR